MTATSLPPELLVVGLVGLVGLALLATGAWKPPGRQMAWHGTLHWLLYVRGPEPGTRRAMFVVFFVSINLLVDLLAMLADPRLRRPRKA